MSTTITFRRGTAAPTPTAGLTLGEPAFDTTNRNLYIGLGSGVTAAWVGARISGLSSDITAGLTNWIVNAKGIKDYVNAVTVTPENVAFVNQANTFTALQTLTAGLSASGATFSGNVLVGATLTVSGNLVVNGTTTTINSTTISVDDKNIVLADTASPSDSTANDGGITIKGSTLDKLIYWKSNDSLAEWEVGNSWHMNQDLNLVSVAGVGGRKLYFDGVEVLNSTTLGSTVVASSLTSVGTITSGTWNSDIVYVDGGTYT